MEYNMPTTGRLPVISFSDEADESTLMSVLSADRYWAVALVLKDGAYPVEVMLLYRTDGRIGGATFDHDTNRWNGPEFVTDIGNVAQVIVL